MYDQGVVRGLFERWGHEEIAGDPGETTSRWCVPRINHMILDRWLPREGTVLDAGCGHGIQAVRMAMRGLNVTAVDISDSLLRHARERAEKVGVADRITFVRADVTEQLLVPCGRPKGPLRGLGEQTSPSTFDVCIALTSVISHCGNRHRDAAANLVACVKPGGLVIIGVTSYYGKIREYLGDGRIDEAEHVVETKLTHTVSDTFEDYCFIPSELKDMLNCLECDALAMFSAPTIGPYGFVGGSDDTMRRTLALEERFLGVPELLGAGGQLIGVFRKSS